MKLGLFSANCLIEKREEEEDEFGEGNGNGRKRPRFMEGFGKKVMEKGKWKEHIEKLLEWFDKEFRLILLGKVDFERVFTVMHKDMYSTVVNEE